MKKKVIGLLVFVLMAGFLTGCTETIDLSEDENDAIAEYAAELLLKYDSTYTSKYKEAGYPTEASSEDTEEDSSNQEADTEEPTTQEGSTEDSTHETTQASTEATTEVGADVSTEGGDNSEATVENDLAKIIGMNELSIVYDTYIIVDKYPSIDTEGAFISIEAPEGMKLIIVNFKINNSTANPVEINLADKDIGYKIVLNDTKVAQPMVTILMNDLGALNSTIAPNSTSDAVLVFQISDGLVDSIKTLKLRITYSGEENTLVIV